MSARDALRSYWQTARTPRYSLLFALPLFLLYEALAWTQPAGRSGQILNGADAILQVLFTAVAGRRGPVLFLLALIGVGAWLIARDLRAHGRGLRKSVFALMLAESVVLALAFGAAVGSLTSSLVPPPAALASEGLALLGWSARLMLSLGAGLYEELLFRVLLVGLLAWAGRALLGWRPLVAGLWAVLLGAMVFSAFHYIGPYADRLQLYSFVFRTIAGVFFSALYLARGFGITAWTHALYDAFLLLV